jgi:signal transduction histidine kinase
VLTDRGLPAALEALRSRTPLPVELSADLDERLPGPVEAAAYYVVGGGADERREVRRGPRPSRSARSGRTAGSSSRSKTTASAGADPARGSGLRGLADRVEALEGELEVTSSEGAGTTVRAVIPLSGL